MRLFALLNFQHVMGYLFAGLLFMVIFGLGLSYAHLRSEDAETRKTAIIARYREGIEDRDAPYPLMMMLIIAGTFIWGICYILAHGLLGVKI